jgi:pyruvate/2-oxoglutarate dehydrogenase complex dihydrolipoamide acyltransferase (E2) component
MFEVRMPQWGMDMTEGTIVQWLKQPGDCIKKGEPLAQIETAKALNTLESPVAGIVARLVAPVDEQIPVQGLIAIIDA